ncbi:ArnT family glycosyltransferase [Poriferisphaera sp. WC338]|uniref:ArnT family glycosyltransferase n=1 Tax=Poriferisphaera sp. WC338 TaxID=3425129 RepID=UPI003D81584A
MNAGSHEETPPHAPDELATEKLCAWASWRNTLLLALIIFIIRLIYSFISPYELVGDEAQYWDWSRHLSWSYFTKGPGVAWTIFASTEIFGNAVWAIRLPTLIAFIIIMLSAARLATHISNGDERPGFFAACLIALCPPLFAAGQLMTIDEPFFACWILAALISYHAFYRLKHDQSATLLWMLVAFILGVGFLYKYTVLLILPGLILFAIIYRKTLKLNQPRNLITMIPAFAIFLITISPVFIWNYQNDWPTVKHLVGHLGIEGGDVKITQENQWKPIQLLGPLEMVVVQILLISPPIIALIVISYRQAQKHKSTNPHQWLGVIYLIYCATPVLVFYFCVGFLKKVQPNWPLAGFLTLIPLAALYGPIGLGKFSLAIQTWKDNNKQGKRPHTPWQVGWHWAIGWGSVAALLIILAPYAQYFPNGENFPGMHRATGFQNDAALIQTQRNTLLNQTGTPPIIIADHYQKTARLAFYLPDHPAVFCAQAYFGARKTDYDRFADTNLNNPDLLGKNAVLMGGSAERWRNAFNFKSIKIVVENPADLSQQIFIAYDYQGPKKPLPTH